MKFVTPYWVNVGLVSVLAVANNEEKSNATDEENDPALLAIDANDDNGDGDGTGAGGDDVDGDEHEGDDDQHNGDGEDGDVYDDNNADGNGGNGNDDDEDLPAIDLSDGTVASDDASVTTKAVRKDSDLTQKMRDWSAEKHRRQKEHQRRVLMTRHA
jgi:hypothetical protein